MSASAHHPWALALIAPLMLAVAIGAGLVVHALLFAVLRRLAAKPGRVIEASLVRHASSPSRWILPLVALLAVLPLVPLLPVLRGALQHLTGLGVIAAVAWGIILLADVLADVIAVRHRIDVSDNLEARRIQTQVQVMRRVLTVTIVILALGVMLMTFPGVRAIGTSLLASAGLAGLVIGMAMKPTFGNLIAGIQIALTQPIRMEDAVIVEGEWGWIEEITATYVVVRTWDWRRLVLPLTYFIEHPFQNWTRRTAELIGSVYLYLDYSTPIAALRQELERICKSSDKWRGQVCVLQVTDAKEHTIEVRALADAKDAGAAWDLRCLIREGLIGFVQQHYPRCLPKTRAVLEATDEPATRRAALPA